ncbi:hypothetical protein GCM10007094_43150 [Pseudovibrio japonicus]|uniref:Uncharacterized protein n=1 Tax=Pseudovibrio japonicus TaxID=366534 RepID=A0ABQ3EP34_9HYPH|nr:hypothetical protein [Pseudovibrio japonicus]GHB49293.1 hypothetical protein GCM10007094_43150 [Pseudovibrio japonicus]
MRRKTFSVWAGAFSFLFYYCLFLALLAIIGKLLTQSGMDIQIRGMGTVVSILAAGFTVNRIVEKTFQRPKGWRLFTLSLLCALSAALVEAMVFMFQYAEFKRLVGSRADEVLEIAILGGTILGVIKFFVIWLALWGLGAVYLRRMRKDPDNHFHDGTDGLEGYKTKRIKERVEPDF